jgi:hypothetical protein
MADPAALRDAQRRAGEGLAEYRVDRMSRAYVDVYWAAMQSRREDKAGSRSRTPASATKASGREAIDLDSRPS